MKEFELFISYSSKDQQQVSAYANFLRSEGYSVWIDQADISHGHEFPEEITKAIQGCSILLFFSSKNSNASKWVRREIVFADKLNKTILPICLDNSEYNQSLQLLLSGVEHIDATSKTQDDIRKTLLAAIGREIGHKGNSNTCPVVSKPCPIGKTAEDKKESSVQEKLNVSNMRMAFRYRIRCEAFVFTALVEAIWLLILGIPLISLGVLTHTFSLFVCSVVAYFLAMYTTHMSTYSTYVPGWYNRHLTAYGALILAMDFFLTVACLSISIVWSVDIIISLLFLLCSVVGVVSIACIYRLKKIGYYMLWVDTVLFTVSSYYLWKDDIRIIGMIGLFIVLVFAMVILTYTLKLRYNGNSTWGLLFGKEKDSEDQEPSMVERLLMKIWINLYK